MIKLKSLEDQCQLNYGTGAVFGVINIITNGESEGVSGSISGSYGTQNSHRLSGRYTARTEDLNLSLNLMSYAREGFNEQWGDLVSGFDIS